MFWSQKKLLLDSSFPTDEVCKCRQILHPFVGLTLRICKLYAVVLEMKATQVNREST